MKMEKLKFKSKRSNSRLDFEKNSMQLLKSKSSKIGQGHVEMIISFAIFIGFVVTLLFFMNPLKSKQTSYTLLDITEETILNSWTINYSVVSLTITNPAAVSGNYFAVANQPRLSGNLVAKDKNKKIKKASNANDIILEHAAGDKFYLIYSSESFKPTSLSAGAPINPADYSFGALSTYEKVYYDNIAIFQQQYLLNYTNLKESLNLKNDFNFYVFNESYAVLFNGTTFVPKYVEVIARETPIIAINNTADAVNLILNIQMW